MLGSELERRIRGSPPSTKAASGRADHDPARPVRPHTGEHEQQPRQAESGGPRPEHPDQVEDRDGRTAERREEDEGGLAQQQVAERTGGARMPPEQSADEEGHDVRDDHGRELGGIRRYAPGQDEYDGDGQSRYAERDCDEIGLPQRRPECRVASPALELQGLEVGVVADGRAIQGDGTPSPRPWFRRAKFRRGAPDEHNLSHPAWGRQLAPSCCQPTV